MDPDSCNDFAKAVQNRLRVFPVQCHDSYPSLQKYTRAHAHKLFVVWCFFPTSPYPLPPCCHRWSLKMKIIYPPGKDQFLFSCKDKMFTFIVLSLWHMYLNGINKVPTTGFLSWLLTSLKMLIFKDIKTRVKEIRSFQIRRYFNVWSHKIK